MEERQFNNKKIADFLGIKYAEARSWDEATFTMTHSITSLDKFRTSWDWLIPVVKKIQKYYTDTGRDNLNIELLSELATLDIEKVYASVLVNITLINRLNRKEV